jgi:hypothetical protein
MTIVDYVEQHIGGILSVGQVTDFVDHQNVSMGVGQQRILQLSLLAGIGEIFDQFCGSGEVGFEAILNGAITDGYRQMSFPSDTVLPRSCVLRCRLSYFLSHS